MRNLLFITSGNVKILRDDNLYSSLHQQANTTIHISIHDEFAGE